MKTKRNIVVKTRLNADEFITLDKRCEAAGLSHSTAIRIVVMPWAGIDMAKDIKPIVIKERPKLAPKRARFPGAQVSHGANPHRKMLF